MIAAWWGPLSSHASTGDPELTCGSPERAFTFGDRVRPQPPRAILRHDATRDRPAPSRHRLDDPPAARRLRRAASHRHRAGDTHRRRRLGRALEASAAAVVDLSFVLEGELIDEAGQNFRLEVEVLAIPAEPAIGLYILQPDAIADNQIVIVGDDVRSYTFLTNQVGLFDTSTTPTPSAASSSPAPTATLPLSISTSRRSSRVGTRDRRRRGAPRGTAMVRFATGSRRGDQTSAGDGVEATLGPVRLVFLRDGDELFADLRSAMERDQGLTRRGRHLPARRRRGAGPTQELSLAPIVEGAPAPSTAVQFGRLRRPNCQAAIACEVGYVATPRAASSLDGQHPLRHHRGIELLARQVAERERGRLEREPLAVRLLRDLGGLVVADAWR